MIDAKMVAELRKATGAAVMDVKNALQTTGGNREQAIEELRKKGILKAAKKDQRETKEGRVHCYIHANGKVGALLEVQCETDFVAKNQEFIDFCHDLAMHVVAADPQYLYAKDVPQEILEKEKEIYRQEMASQQKTQEVLEKIVEGKIQKYFKEVCFFEQDFVKDDSKTVNMFIKEKIGSLGENIQVTRFARFQI